MKSSIQKTAHQRKRRRGVVVSAKMEGTAVVQVTTTHQSGKYLKRYSRDNRYKADNPGNIYKEGQRVVIEECRPLSRGKNWRIVSQE